MIFQSGNIITHLKQDKGNALWFILLGVALLGFLTSVISRNTSSTNQSVSQENAIIYLSQAMKYTQALELAIQNLRLNNGCSENELSFENREIEDYDNIDAPDDYRCHLFHRNGGAQTWKTHGYDDKEWFITSTAMIDESPESDRADLIMFLRDVSETFCTQANLRINDWETTPDFDASTFWSSYFTGSFLAPTATLSFDVGGEEQKNITSGCFYNNSDDEYDFFYTLYLR